MIADSFGRRFSTLRLSLTPVCDFACRYCVSQESGTIDKNKIRSLDPDEYLRLVGKIHEINPLGAVRLTGGEPLLYKKIDILIKKLKDAGIPKVRLTTNARRLAGMAKKLKQAGLDSLNVSLDAIDYNVSANISGRNHLDQIYSGIEKALERDLPLKLNATIMKGVNDSQIPALLNYAKKMNVIIRFLELMKMGPLYKNHDQYFFNEKLILEAIKKVKNFQALPRKKSSTARYWKAHDGQEFGIISNHSNSFCHDCDRLRMDSTGKIYGCLTSSQGIDITANKIDDSGMEFLLRKSLSQKQSVFSGSEVSMKAIGG